jgi:hypothetical protein
LTKTHGSASFYGMVGQGQERNWNTLRKRGRVSRTALGVVPIQVDVRPASARTIIRRGMPVMGEINFLAAAGLV